MRKQLIQPDGGRFAGERDLQLQAHPDPRRRLPGDPQGGCAPISTSASPTGWSARRASAPASTRRSSGYHLERAYRYLSELGPLDDHGRELRGPGRRPARDRPGARALARGDIRARRQPARARGVAAARRRSRPGATSRSSWASPWPRPASCPAPTRCSHDRIEAERRGRAFVVFHDAHGQAARRQPRRASAPRSPSAGAPDNDVVAVLGQRGLAPARRAAPRGPEGWTLVDEESRNGSYLNGERVPGEQRCATATSCASATRSSCSGPPSRAGPPAVGLRSSRSRRPPWDSARRTLRGRPSDNERRAANPPADRSVSELKARIEAERTGHPFLLYADGDDQQQLFSLEPGLTQASVGRRDVLRPRARLGRPGLAPPRPVRAGRARTGRSWTTASRATARS